MGATIAVLSGLQHLQQVYYKAIAYETLLNSIYRETMKMTEQCFMKVSTKLRYNR